MAKSKKKPEPKKKPKPQKTAKKGKSKPYASEPVFDLGPLTLPKDGDEALKILRELAHLNDEVLEAQFEYNEAAKVAKALKGDWEECSEKLSKRLRAASHPEPLPLFDQDEEQVARENATKNQVKA